MKAQLSGAKFKYSCRLDKPVLTKDDYIEELEMRFEESADIWKLTCEHIYGGNGYVVKEQDYKNKIKQLEEQIKEMQLLIQRLQAKEAEVAQYLSIIEQLQIKLQEYEECTKKENQKKEVKEGSQKNDTKN